MPISSSVQDRATRGKSCEAFSFKNWGEAPRGCGPATASAGCMGGDSWGHSHFAPARRKGGIAGHEVPWRPRCASFARFCGACGNQRSTLLAVLRRSRSLSTCHCQLPVRVYAADPLFSLLKTRNCQIEDFSFHPAFPAYFFFF